MTDKEKIREAVEKRYEYWREKEFNSHSIESEIRMSECQHLLLMLNSLQEEPASEELEKAAEDYSNNLDNIYGSIGKQTRYAFKAGAQWQKEQMMEQAIDGEIGYWNLHGLSVNVKLPHSVEEGDKAKVIVIKED